MDTSEIVFSNYHSGGSVSITAVDTRTLKAYKPTVGLRTEHEQKQSLVQQIEADRIKLAPLKWSKEKPTTEGHYWFRGKVWNNSDRRTDVSCPYHEWTADIHFVSDFRPMLDGLGTTADVNVADVSYEIELFDGEWAGPILLPQE